MMMNDASGKAYRRLVYILVLLLCSAFIWAYVTDVDEVTRGEGTVIPAGRTQTIQATEPGVVKEINVKIGQVVKAGDIIIRLDDTTTASDLGEVQARVRALKAKIERLNLEEKADFDGEFKCPEPITGREVCDNEIQLLAVHKETFINAKKTFEQRIIQRQKEKDEALANLERLRGSLEISQREHSLISPMVKRALVAKTELIRVERELNETEGALNALLETIPRAEGAVEEAKLQLEELELHYRQEALSQKTAALAELSVLAEAERGETNRVERTDIRSPVDGIINTMEINTIGSFLQPGAIVAVVVPTSEELLVEVKILPKDVAFIVPGQKALVKITAFDFSIYGGLEGIVKNVGSDSILDPQTGEAYFEVRIKTNKSYLERNNKKYNITPGMVCSADILTGKKTILNYLLKPLFKARQEALTER